MAKLQDKLFNRIIQGDLKELSEKDKEVLQQYGVALSENSSQVYITNSALTELTSNFIEKLKYGDYIYRITASTLYKVVQKSSSQCVIRSEFVSNQFSDFIYTKSNSTWSYSSKNNTTLAPLSSIPIPVLLKENVQMRYAGDPTMQEYGLLIEFGTCTAFKNSIQSGKTPMLILACNNSFVFCMVAPTNDSSYPLQGRQCGSFAFDQLGNSMVARVKFRSTSNGYIEVDLDENFGQQVHTSGMTLPYANLYMIEF